MTLLTIATIAIAALIHWYAVNPNRRTDGRFAKKTKLERYGVYVLLVAACVLVLVGCSPTAHVPTVNSVSVYRDGPYTVTLTRSERGVTATAHPYTEARTK